VALNSMLGGILPGGTANSKMRGFLARPLVSVWGDASEGCVVDLRAKSFVLYGGRSCGEYGEKFGDRSSTEELLYSLGALMV